VDALSARNRYYQAACRFMGGFDLLLTPAMPCTALSLEDRDVWIGGRRITSIYGARFPMAYTFNLTGWPAGAVPCGIASDGLPVGLQVVAPWRRDDVCLAACAAYEALDPWRHRRPPAAELPGPGADTLPSDISMSQIAGSPAARRDCP
jgi:Asp-tRNA(Asn)/Glu-tRNA(Gln) amidotransferase A subunit family amidase